MQIWVCRAWNHPARHEEREKRMNDSTNVPLHVYDDDSSVCDYCFGYGSVEHLRATSKHAYDPQYDPEPCDTCRGHGRVWASIDDVNMPRWSA